MKINSLEIEQFRNIQSMEFLPCDGVNIIYGDNAQGKTNLLEAVWLFSGAKSFRGAKDAELIPFDSEHAALNLSFFSDDRQQSAVLRYGRNMRAVFLNEIKQDSRSALSGIFCTVVFSPDHLTLVKGAPGERRRMIDDSLGQAYPKYSKILLEYEKALKQRNRLLKDITVHASLIDTLDAWDQSLIEYGSYISHMRSRYVLKLSQIAQEIYGGISLGKENFSAIYCPSHGSEIGDMSRHEYRDILQQALYSARAEDIRLGVTTVGPHRDDLDIMVNEMPARMFASQGQQRSCVLALKLAECSILEQRSGEAPIVLLDDVMSELDEHRRSYLLSRLVGRQIIITCCDSGAFEGQINGKLFEIKSGKFK